MDGVGGAKAGSLPLCGIAPAVQNLAEIGSDACIESLENIEGMKGQHAKNYSHELAASFCGTPRVFGGSFFVLLKTFLVVATPHRVFSRALFLFPTL
jgi:hypothetical protein